MIDAELLEILVCPETKQGLVLAAEDLIEKLNQTRLAGALKNRVGQTVKDEFQAGLVREDGLYLYQIQDDIPIMLIDEAIPLV